MWALSTQFPATRTVSSAHTALSPTLPRSSPSRSTARTVIVSMPKAYRSPCAAHAYRRIAPTYTNRDRRVKTVRPSSPVSTATAAKKLKNTYQRVVSYAPALQSQPTTGIRQNRHSSPDSTCHPRYRFSLRVNNSNSAGSTMEARPIKFQSPGAIRERRTPRACSVEANSVGRPRSPPVRLDWRNPTTLGKKTGAASIRPTP